MYSKKMGNWSNQLPILVPVEGILPKERNIIDLHRSICFKLK